MRRQQEDKLVVVLGGSRESIYSTAWSAKNMWLFCGASYEGKLLFGNVPSEKERDTIRNDSFIEYSSSAISPRSWLFLNICGYRLLEQFLRFLLP